MLYWIRLDAFARTQPIVSKEIWFCRVTAEASGKIWNYRRAHAANILILMPKYCLTFPDFKSDTLLTSFEESQAKLVETLIFGICCHSSVYIQCSSKEN
jgi:hypothetical protein